MKSTLIIYYIIDFILLGLLIISICAYFKSSRTLKLTNRLLRFSVHKLENENTSFFDKIEYLYKNILEKTSNILSKSKILTSYSKTYEKYIDDSLTRKKEMYIVSNKITIAFSLTLLNIIYSVIKIKAINPLSLIIAFIIGFIIPDIVLLIGKKKSEKRVEKDFLKAVIIMNNAFKSGRSIIQAIEVVAKEMDGKISNEFNKMYIDLTYGLDLEVVFERFSKRVNIEESKYMASSLIIINKTGGDVVKVFQSIEKSFMARKRLNDELKSVTALSRFVFRVLEIIPFIIIIAISIMNKDYFKIFFTHQVGRLMLLIIIILYIIYLIIIKKVMKVKG